MTQPPPPRQPARKAAAQRVAPDEDLRSVQLMLEMAGFDPGATDGIPGPATTEALRRFQRANKLRPDGVADEKTLDLLSRVTANLPPPGSKAAAQRREPASGEASGSVRVRRAPAITRVEPAAFPARTAVTLEIHGSGYTRDSEVHLAGSGTETLVFDETVEFVRPELLKVAVDERAFEASGPVSVTVRNPGPDGAGSLPVVVEVTNVAAGVAEERRSYLPGFSADSTVGVDLLGRQARVDFLASVLAAKQLETPLAVGLFGDWGSGKSFFMNRLQERIVELTEASARAEKEEQPSYYCSHVRQVTFNAWLYADSDIWPAFAAQVFRGVCGLESDVPEGATQAADLAEYQEQLRAKVQAAAEASEREERIRAVEATIEEKQEEIARVGADVGPAGQVVVTLREIGTRLVGLRSGWRELRAEDVVVLLAVVVGAAALALFDGAERWLLALGAAAGLVVAVLRSLDSARTLRAEVRDLKEQLAEERRAQQEETGLADTARELPLLPEFAAKEVEKWSQRVKLGVVTEIRLKFERLSRMIDESRRARTSGTAKPDEQLPIDRVIVYVDDLDRCQPDVVVRVLETLKLLLSLPHFVVVVGVDSRWLFRSLELHFQQFLTHRDGASPDLAWAATPQNYLEKIFQYSVVLRPIGAEGFARLVDTLLHVDPMTSGGDDSDGDAEDVPAAPRSTPADGTGFPDPGYQPESAEAAHEIAAPVAARDVDLTPHDLVVTAEEREFVKALARMFETPRAVKRLANVYRLLRVSVGSERVVGGEGFEPVLLLLSIGIGFPGLAGDVFRAIMQSPEMPWPDFVDDLSPVKEPDEDKFHNVAVDEIEAHEVVAWQKLASSLALVSPEAVADRTLATFAEWIPTVAEFSFHPWQELLAAEASA